MRSIAPRSIWRNFLPRRAAKRVTKYSTRTGRSSRRSRKAGTSIGNTFRR